MTSPFTDYHTPTLILLIGDNPLPNFVAAQLLTTNTARLLLVHSEGTRDQSDNLKKVLEKRGYNINENDLIEAEDSNPADIYSKVQNASAGSGGIIGLNYTGGTKAMAVHAYRALEQADGLTKRYYSYLDARTLSMRFTDDLSNTWFERVEDRVKVSLAELLMLHGHKLENLKQEMSEEVRWPETTQALVEIYSNPTHHEEWREWYKTHSFNQDHGPSVSLSTNEFPQPIREALERDNTTLAFPVTFHDLTTAGGFKPEGRRSAAGVCGKWFTSTWLEEYVFRQVQAIQSTCKLNDLKMSIEPALGSDDSFEFDVAFMRGHQLFGLSCSAMTNKPQLKEKLLEAAVRAAQLGGGETCFALVCCADGNNLRDLKNQLDSLPNLNKRRIRVFGRHDLIKLQTHLKDWIRKASS